MAEDVENIKTPVTLEVSTFTTRQVHELDYTFKQATDKEGQPMGIPRGGTITLKVKALNNGNAELLNWMTAAQLYLPGKIKFMRPDDQGNQMKEIQFSGHCVEYTEHWEDPDGAKSLAHYEKITISCKEIFVGAVLWYNKWL